MKKHSKEWARNEIMKALPINGLFKWYADNHPGYGFDYWADEVLEMRDEGLIEINEGKITRKPPDSK